MWPSGPASMPEGAARKASLRRLAVVDAGAAQDRGHDTRFPVAAAHASGAVAPEHGPVRVGQEAGLHRVARRLGAMDPLFAPPGHAGAHERRHDAGGGVDPADPVAVFLADEQVVPLVQADGVRHQRAGFGGRPPVAVGRRHAVAEHGGDDAGGHVDLADAVVRVVADVEIAPGVEGQVLGMVEGGVRGRAAVAVVAAPVEAAPVFQPLAQVRPAPSFLRRIVAGVVAGEEFDDAGPCVHLPNRVLPLAGQVEVAGRIHRYAAVDVQLRLEGGTPVAAAAGPAGSGHPRDDAGMRVDPADRAIRKVGGVDVAAVVESQAVGAAQPSLQRRPAVAAIPRDAVAGEGVQDAVPVDAPEAVGVPVGDDQIAFGAADDADGPAYVGLFRRHAGFMRRTRDGGDVAGGQLWEKGIQVHGAPSPNWMNTCRAALILANKEGLLKGACKVWKAVRLKVAITSRGEGAQRP